MYAAEVRFPLPKLVWRALRRACKLACNFHLLGSELLFVIDGK